MAIVFTEDGERDFGALDNSIRVKFIKQFDKLLAMPPRRHLRGGNPYFCENVTEQARLAYRLDGDDICIIRCFATHKEYERWYRGMGRG